MHRIGRWGIGISLLALAACQPEPTPLPVAFPTQAQAAIVLTDAPPERTDTDSALRAYTLAIVIREEDETIAAWLRDALDPAGLSSVLSLSNVTPAFERASSGEQLRGLLANIGYPDGLLLTAARVGETPEWAELQTLYRDFPVTFQSGEVENANLVFVGWRGDSPPQNAPARDETWIMLLQTAPVP